MPTTILSSRFNNLRNRISAIMGNTTSSAPTTGYGQTISSSTVVGQRSVNDLSSASKITDEQYRSLYTDLVRARVHQIGSAFTIDPFVVGDYLTNTVNTDKVEEIYIQNLETLMTEIEAEKFEIDLSTQATVENVLKTDGNPLVSTRLESTAGPWNGTLSHIFTIDFTSAEDRRHFFNAGGQIRFSANIDYAFTQTKTDLWKNTLSTMGVIAFKANETESLGNGSFRSIGNYTLGSTYTLAFRQNIGGVYSGSYYEVYALENSPTQIQFRIYFRDSTVEIVDEDVFGDITSRVQVAIPNGQVTLGGNTIDTVVLDTELTATELSPLTTSAISTPPTYSLSPLSVTLNEGVPQNFTMTTTNVANGTTLYWTINDPGNDFVNSSGLFNIISNSGSFTVETRADLTPESTETFTLNVRTGNSAGPVVASATITVVNTS